MAITKNSCSDETSFVRRVVISSLFIVVILINLIGIAAIFADDLRGLAAVQQAKTGNFISALELTDSIEDEAKCRESRYSVACIMSERGEFGLAAEQYAQLQDHRDSREKYLACRYDLAGQLRQSGAYDEALEIFASLGDYSDAALRCDQVIYSKAEKAADDGEHAQAIMLFLSLGDYSDARQRAFDAAMEVTGDRTAAEDMLSNGGMTGEQMALSVRIAERRALLPEYSIAAGSYHTVVLHADGTVSACGDNSSGQCDVSGWRDIVQVHAGAKHTVGLKADGTVVAAGDNSFGQCDVSGWTGVTELAVNDYNTLALISDGKVMNCGYNAYNSLEELSGVSHIYAGGYAAAAVKDNGTYICSHKSHSLQPDMRIVHASLNTGYAAALLADGTCLFSADLETDWKDMVWVDAGSTAVIGVDVDGGIKTRFFRSSDEIRISADKEVLQCAAGTAHFVFLTTDGEVLAFGDNSMGQCDVELLG